MIIRDILQKAHYRNYEYLKIDKLIQQRFAGKRILDVGCGTGDYLKLFAKYDCPTVGVDLNSQQVKTLRHEGYTVYSPEDLPENETFEIIFMSHVIEHLEPSKLILFLEKYLRMLAPDGKLIILSPVLGERFFYDFSHVRPYYPQSVWMLLGDCIYAASYKSPMRIALNDIYFFNDSIRLRGGLLGRYYYPCVGQHEPHWKYSLISNAVLGINLFFALLHRLSGGKLGVRASWCGIYSKTEE